MLTGWYTNGVINSSSREVLQGSYNGTVVNLVKGSSLVDGISVGYAATSLPSGFKLLTVNYYDDYTFPDGPTVFPTGSNNEYEVYYNNSDKKPKGMATGSWIRVLTSTSSTVGEKSYILYDIKGRPVKSYGTNYLGGFISTETKLDFVGKPIYTVTKHLREVGDTPIELREDFTYSDQDRLLTHVHEIVGQTPPEILAQNEYEEMGQLVMKNVGGNDQNGGMSLQKVDYSYNIRGWLKEINNVDELSMEEPRDLFAFKINYNQPENTLGGQIQELYNGNISETLWTTDSDDLKRSYGYQYDALNRLLKAKYQKQGAETGSYDESLQYDKNGNIRGLQRNGYIDSDDQGMIYPIDELIYTYDNYNNSNRLLSVYDSSNSLDGFKDGNTSGDDYDYDNYGNMKRDRNKGIDRIYYNHLNLPTRIIFSNSSEIHYLYNAAGVKVLKKVASAITGYELDGDTHYLSGFQYKDNELQLFPTAEGYVNVTDGGKFNYVYNYTDHLGNVRVSYSYDDRENELKILEENHYYPFGLKHSYNTDRYDFARDENDNIFVVLEPVDRNKYQYKYNGKEYQDELGLNMYNMDMRQYDPAIGRWVVQDPVIHHSMSPYNAFDNNPVFWADPSGSDAVYNWDGPNKGKYTDNGEVVDFTTAMASHGLNTSGDPIKTTTDAGHGDKTGCCTDPGTLDGDNYEKDFALKVEASVDSWLKKWGIDNQRTRTGDIDKKGQKKIAWRLKSAKEHGSIVMISIHLDSGSKDGLFAIYDGDNSESKKLALSIVNAYSFGLGDSDGIKSDVRNLGLVQRFSGKASVLIELGGIGNTDLINRINQNSNLMGYDIARGMYKYLTGNEPPSKNGQFEWPKSPYTSFLNH